MMRATFAPDTILIAITFADGTLGVMHFVVTEYNVDGTPRWARPATKENVDAEIERSQFDAEKRPIKGWRYIMPDDLPKHRIYRAAWKDTGTAIDHDMDRARAHHRKMIRHLRRPAMDKLDGEWMKAVAKNDATTARAIDEKRQALRDAPADPRIDAAKTIDDLLKLDLNA